MAKNPHIIVYNPGTGRFEVWHESREVAHSTTLEACQRKYPDAETSELAWEMADRAPS